MFERTRMWFVASACVALVFAVGACGPRKPPATGAEDPERTRVAVQEEHGVDVSFDVPQILGVAGESLPADRRAQAVKWLEEALTVYPTGVVSRVIDRVNLVGKLEVGSEPSDGVLLGRVLIASVDDRPNRRKSSELFHSLLFGAFEKEVQRMSQGPAPAREAVNVMGRLKVWQASLSNADASMDDPLSWTPYTVAGKLLTRDGKFLSECERSPELRSRAETMREVAYLASNKAMDDLFWAQLTGPDAGMFRSLAAEAIMAEAGPSGRPPSEASPSRRPAGDIPTLENLREVDIPTDDVVVSRPGRRSPRRTSSPASTYQAGMVEFEAGRYRKASQVWRRMLFSQPGNYYVIHLGVSCFLDEVKAAKAALEPEFTFFTLRYWSEGRECFLMFSGLYANPEGVKADLARLNPLIGDRYVIRGLQIAEAKKLLPSDQR